MIRHVYILIPYLLFVWFLYLLVKDSVVSGIVLFGVLLIVAAGVTYQKEK